MVVKKAAAAETTKVAPGFEGGEPLRAAARGAGRRVERLTSRTEII